MVWQTSKISKSSFREETLNSSQSDPTDWTPRWLLYSPPWCFSFAFPVIGTQHQHHCLSPAPGLWCQGQVFGRSVFQHCERKSWSASHHEIRGAGHPGGCIPWFHVFSPSCQLTFGLISVFGALRDTRTSAFWSAGPVHIPILLKYHFNPDQSSSSAWARIKGSPLQPFSQITLVSKSLCSVWNLKHVGELVTNPGSG